MSEDQPVSVVIDRAGFHFDLDVQMKPNVEYRLVRNEDGEWVMRENAG